MAIIGGWRVKYLRAAKKPKKQIHLEYSQRNEALPFLGYASYREYLASDEWKEIRSKCLACR